MRMRANQIRREGISSIGPESSTSNSNIGGPNENGVSNTGQTSGVASAHRRGYRDGESLTKRDNVMKNVMLALFVVPFLSLPAFAGALNAGDKATVVAENVEVGVGGVAVGVGERNRHRDHRDLYMSTRGHRDHRDDHHDDRR